MTASPAQYMPHLVVVDDDKKLRDLLVRYLSDNGFRISAAKDAAEARILTEDMKVDLAIVDIMMPGENGLDLTKHLHKTTNIPILLLTAMGDVGDRIRGLESGADEYLPKPFEPKELLLRIRKILGRMHQIPEAVSNKVRIGRCHFDLDRRMLFSGDTHIPLTETEATLLTLLIQSGDKALSREELASSGSIDINPRSIDVQITRLRRKIEEDPKRPRYIITVRHAGYVLRPD